MLATNIWNLIAEFLEKVAFIPYNALRSIDSWWASNIVNWFFIVVAFLSFFYWMGQMYAYKRDGKEDNA